MDREEAIYTLKNTAWLGTDEDRDKTEQAVDMAIKSLSAEQKEEELAEDIARRMATIIENEQDMRIILKNASAEPTVIRCRTLLSDEDFKAVAERIRETNQNVIVIPCEAEVVSTETSTETSTDLISRAEVLDIIAFKRKLANIDGRILLDEIEDRINALPSSDRPSGEWTDMCACSICGFQPWYERDIHTLSYCPNCGAKMKGGTE